MLAANEAVARELKKRAIPTVYRVHENPDPEKLAEYREFVLSFNYKVGDLTHRAEVQRLLASIRGKPEEQALKIGSAEKFEARALCSRSRSDITGWPNPIICISRVRFGVMPIWSCIGALAGTHTVDIVGSRTTKQRHGVTRPTIRRGVRSAQRATRTPDMSQIASIAEHLSMTERTAAEAEIEAVQDEEA